MFKIDHFVIQFACIFALAIVPVFMKTEYVTAETNLTEDAQKYLVEASTRAMKEINLDTTYVFSDEIIRESAVEAFYSSLYDSYNKDYSESEFIREKVPCVMLVDRDGFYVEYNEYYHDSSGKLMTNDIITPLNTWSAVYSNYVVRFFMTDRVEVYRSGTSEKAKGTRAEVYEALNSPQALAFLVDDDKFNAARNEIITNKIEEALIFYVNEYNKFFNYETINYDAFIPENADNIHERAIDTPCVIAFYQGQQKIAVDDFINIWAFRASDEDESEIYYIYDAGDGLKYHKEGCGHLSGVDLDILDSGTSQYCASRGFFPCENIY